MTSMQQPRQPSGTPTGGQFASASKSSPDISLSAASSAGPPAGAELALYELDDVPGLLGYDSGEEWNGFPVPWLTEQSLDHIAQATTWWRDEDREAPLVFKEPETGEWMIDDGEGHEDTAESPRIRPVTKGIGPRARTVYRLDGWTFYESPEWGDEEIEDYVDQELGHYLDAARFTSGLDRRDVDSLPWSDGARRQMHHELSDFVTANQHLIRAAYANYPEYDNRGSVADDFWLTRNRHGSGFWDRGLGAVGDELTAAAKAHGSVEAYIGGDGQLHVR